MNAVLGVLFTADHADGVDARGAVLAQVHEVVRSADDDLDLDPALAACVQRSLAGPHPAPDSQSVPPSMTLSAFGMNLHAATTSDGSDRKQPETGTAGLFDRCNI